LATICDQIVYLALPALALLSLGMSAQQASLLAAAQWLPVALLGGLAGRVVDASAQSCVLGLGALCSGAACALFMIVDSVPNAMRFHYLIAACLVCACGGLLFSVAAAAAAPALAVKVPAPNACGMQAATRSTARVVGLGLAGPLIQGLGVPHAMLIAALCALVRLLMVNFLPALRVGLGVGPVITDRPERTAAKDAVWRNLARHPSLGRVALAAVLLNLGGATNLGAFFVFAFERLNLAPGWVGAMLFAGGIAAVFAAHGSTILLRRVGALKVCSVSATVAALGVWIMPCAIAWPAPLLLIYELIFSASATLFLIALAVLRQRSVAEDRLGRVIGAFATLNAASIFGGLLLASLLIAKVGALGTIVVGCSICSTAAFPSLSLLWRADPA
jgi:hypothetical protein